MLDHNFPFLLWLHVLSCVFLMCYWFYFFLFLLQNLYIDSVVAQFCFVFVPLNKVSLCFFLSSQWRQAMWVFVVCSVPSVFLPHNERLYFPFSTYIDCFLQICLFCVVPHLTLLSLLFGTKLLSQMLPPETVASCLQYKNVWPLPLEGGRFVSSS